MRDFGNDIFEGTAKYYARYRVRYPQKLLDDIVDAFHLDGRGTLLDLGCGTGELAIPLSRFFESVIAWDPDEGMLEEGNKKAKGAGVKNIIWQKKSSKDLPSLKRSFRLVTMGSSFHWMEQEEILNQLFDLVEPNGGVAIAGGAKPLEFSSEASERDKIIQAVIKKYLGPERRAGKQIYTHPEKSFEEYLQVSKFHDFKEHYYEAELTRNIDEVVGNLFSTSFASKKQLGEQVGEFEKDLRDKIANVSKNGKFTEKLEFSLFTVRG